MAATAPTVLRNFRRESTMLVPRIRASSAMTALPVRKLIYNVLYVLYDVLACICLAAERRGSRAGRACRARTVAWNRLLDDFKFFERPSMTILPGGETVGVPTVNNRSG